MDILTDVLHRVRLNGTLLFHYELGCPWSLALPRFPDAVFHYLSRGSAIVALEDGPTLQMADGDFVLITRGEPARKHLADGLRQMSRVTGATSEMGHVQTKTAVVLWVRSSPNC